MLGEATDLAGGPQLRAVGTIGGNVCNGSPLPTRPPPLWPWTSGCTCAAPRRGECAHFPVVPGGGQSGPRPLPSSHAEL